jgi:hypothetical protein
MEKKIQVRNLTKTSMEWMGREGKRKTVTFGFLLLCKPLRIELEIKELAKESFDELNEAPSEERHSATANSSVQKNKFAVFPNEIRWKRVQAERGTMTL